MFLNEFGLFETDVEVYDINTVLGWMNISSW